MNFKTPFSFKGRINRKKYFFYHLVFATLITTLTTYKTSYNLLNLFFAVLALVITFSLTSKSVQRLHDINTAGIFILIPIVIGVLSEFLNILVLSPIGLGFFVYLMIRKGTNGPNKYGDDPLAKPSQTEDQTLEVE